MIATTEPSDVTDPTRTAVVRALAITLWGLVAACGVDDPLAPGAGDDPGTGTATLTVRGHAAAEPVFANATSASDFVTWFAIELERTGVRVTTGSVVVTSAAGAVPLTFDTRDGGQWRGQQSGYYQVYRLDVTADADAVAGVRVDGPDVHQFTAPMTGATVDATLPLAVSWQSFDE